MMHQFYYYDEDDNSEPTYQKTIKCSHYNEEKNYCVYMGVRNQTGCVCMLNNIQCIEIK